MKYLSDVEMGVARSRVARVLIVLLLMVSLVQGVALTSLVHADEPEALIDEPRPTPKPAAAGIKRVAGDTAIDTSLAIADALKRELGVSKFKSVVLVSADKYADALSGAPFAERRLGPVLLVPKGNATKVLDYIKNNLTPEGRVYIIGGTEAVAESVEAKVKEFAEVERLAGPHRFATNLAVLERMNPKEGMNLFVCYGRSFQDALAASATGIPIMLVDKSISNAQAKFLSKYITPKSKVYIAGGPIAISQQIEDKLKSYTQNVTRVKGNDSYSTATAIAQRFFPQAKQALVATTKTYKDGLSGSVLAYARNCPLLLTAKTNKFETTYNYVTSKNIPSVTILGGNAAVDNDATGLNKAGGRKSGFLTVGGKKYFANGSYVLQKDKIVTSNNKKYYLDKSGVLVTGTHFTKDGATWIADKNGVLTKPNKVVYLTFDDGPGPYTNKLIDILNKHGAKATFFVNGYHTYYNDLIGKAYRSGHAIGNHTYSHDYSIYSSSYRFWNDVDRLNRLIKEQTGTTTKLLRFPGGSSNTVSMSYAYGIMSTLTRQCASKGYTYFDWNVDSGDAGGTYTSYGVYSNIISGISRMNAPVVLCHDIKSYTVNAIEDVIIWGKNRGYVFLPLTTSSPTAHHGVNN